MNRTASRCSGLLAAALVLSACGGGDAAEPAAEPRASFDPGSASSVTPVDDAVVSAAQQEKTVLVYGNANDENMTPVVEAFQAKYPGIKISYLSLGGPDTFQRYLSEKSTGGTTADIIMESDGRLWRDFLGRGEIMDYEDPNLPALPDYADLGRGVAALSMDPLVVLYNNKVIAPDKQPTTLKGLSEMADQLDGKIGTVEVDNSQGYAFTHGYLKEAGEEGWAVLEKLGPATGVEDGTGGIATKMQQGAYVASFAVSGAIRALVDSDPTKILGYKYLEDATTLVPRGIGITKGGTSPNAAKLFYNYLLSVEGQEAACAGGFSPYRAGVECPTGLAAVIAEVGEENLLFGDYSDDFAGQTDAIKTRWDKAFER